MHLFSKAGHRKKVASADALALYLVRNSLLSCFMLDRVPAAKDHPMVRRDWKRWHYVKQMKRKTSSRRGRHVDRGEEAAWYVAHTYAVERNEKYRYVAAANSSESGFNVKNFLTTTGMNVEDQRSAAERAQF